GESYKGLLQADVQMKGKLSSIEAKKYDQFDAKGNFLITGLEYKTPALQDKVMIHKMDMKFSPQALNITALDSEFGKNDFRASGFIDNYLNYFFKSEPLHGDFSFESNYMNLNDFMTNINTESDVQG